MRLHSAIAVLLLASACSNKFDGSDEGPDGKSNDTRQNDTDTDTVGDTYTDDDGDGFTEEEGDCDDGNADVGPNQTEECNGIDDNCNGEIDESGGDTLYYADNDGDTYGDPGDVVEACDQPAGYVTNDEDCDDDHDTAYPGGAEVDWNGIDENCDGLDYDAEACVEAAVNATSEAMTSNIWAISPYAGTYYETLTGFSLPVAQWSISNQYLYLLERKTSLKMVDGDSESYTLTFDVQVGMNDNGYTGYYFKTEYGSVIEGPFWIDVEMDSIYSYVGLDYATYCDAWVDPVDQGFTGSLELSVDRSSQTVSGEAQLSSTYKALTAANVNTISVSGESECQLTYIDLVIDQLGYGDTLGILDDTFETTLVELEGTFEDVLEENIAVYCSAE